MAFILSLVSWNTRNYNFTKNCRHSSDMSTTNISIFLSSWYLCWMEETGGTQASNLCYLMQMGVVSHLSLLFPYIPLGHSLPKISMGAVSPVLRNLQPALLQNSSGLSLVPVKKSANVREEV